MKNVIGDLFKEKYVDVFKGSGEWNELEVSKMFVYDWLEFIYIKYLFFFEVMEKEFEVLMVIENVWCLVKVGDFIIIDYILFVGVIVKDSFVGEYL